MAEIRHHGRDTDLTTRARFHTSANCLPSPSPVWLAVVNSSTDSREDGVNAVVEKSTSVQDISDLDVHGMHITEPSSKRRCFDAQGERCFDS